MRPRRPPCSAGPVCSVRAVDLSRASQTIASAGAAITGRCREAPAEPVAACPGWSVADLTTHVAQIHRWSAAMIEGGPMGAMPDPPAGVDPASWGDEARDLLLDAIAKVDPSTEVATFVGPRPAAWWARRQANETAVHAWDATFGSGSPWLIPDDIAADALDEVLSVFLPRRWGHKAPAWGDGRTVHLHRTDGEGEWLLTIASQPTLEIGHAKGDLAVRAPVHELLLWAIGRPAVVELFGDAELATAWQANVRI